MAWWPLSLRCLDAPRCRPLRELRGGPVRVAWILLALILAAEVVLAALAARCVRELVALHREQFRLGNRIGSMLDREDGE